MSASRAPNVEATATFAPGPLAARDARRWIEPVIATWTDAAGVSDVLLVLSELVTNAVMHGAGPVVVLVRCGRGQLRLEVSDEGGNPGAVAARHTDPETTGGRGLLVVDHIAREWGVTPRPPAGKTVWVVLGGR